MKFFQTLFLVLVSTPAFCSEFNFGEEEYGEYLENEAITTNEKIVIEGEVAKKAYKELLLNKPKQPKAELTCRKRDDERSPDCYFGNDFDVSAPLSKLLWNSVPLELKRPLTQRVNCPGHSCFGRRKVGTEFYSKIDCSAKTECTITIHQ